MIFKSKERPNQHCGSNIKQYKKVVEKVDGQTRLRLKRVAKHDLVSSAVPAPGDLYRINTGGSIPLNVVGVV